jgi:hypothetical protein
MVSSGFTCVVPLEPKDPTPLINTFTAAGAFQDSVVDCPLCILIWAALMPGGMRGNTVTAAEEDTGLPVLPVAVRIYDVVAVGVTVVEPEVPTVPMPGDILTLPALLVVQVRVTVWPSSTWAKFALKELITGG